MTQPENSVATEAVSQAKRPTKSRAVPRVLRWTEHVLAAGAALLIVLLLTPIPQRLHQSMDCQGELRHADYIVCLGGDPNRVLEAARLLNEGYADKLVLSNRESAARMMQDLAVDWGARADRILIDGGARCTADHPFSIQRECGVDPARDVCIVVTTYEHMARSKACFEKAGYSHVIMREPRWERQFRHDRGGLRANFWIMPQLIYEYTAYATYWLRGKV